MSEEGICDCDCHKKAFIMHCVPCCEGHCEHCGKWFLFGYLQDHKTTCGRKQHDLDCECESELAKNRHSA